MNKPFYTDPLAAAWMAKHFGMRLQAETDFDGLVDAGARFIDCDDTFRELWQHDFSYLGKIYIHPDSLHLLEPQVDDLILYKKEQPSFVATHEPYDDEYYTTSLEAARSLKNSLTIIQRNNTAFIWPDTE